MQKFFEEFGNHLLNFALALIISLIFQPIVGHLVGSNKRYQKRYLLPTRYPSLPLKRGRKYYPLSPKAETRGIPLPPSTPLRGFFGLNTNQFTPRGLGLYKTHNFLF